MLTRAITDDFCSWGAVVRGAVLKGVGLGSSMAEHVKICPRHYGVCVSERFTQHLHLDEETVVDRLQGYVMVTEQFVWLVRKGDLIPSDEPITATYDVYCVFESRDITSKRVVRISFVASAADEPPSKRTGEVAGKNQKGDFAPTP
jgi:hypothetical protein